jgi:glycosyltransferase involved in cell wall biosynthesis
MRILHIIAGDLWAGAEVQVYNTLASLQKQDGVKVLCVVFNTGVLVDRLKQAGIPCELIDDSKNSIPAMIFKMLKVSGRLNPDIIHVHRSKEHFFGAIISIRLFRRIPVFRTIHGLSQINTSSTPIVLLKSTIAVTLNKFLISFLSTRIICVSNDIFDIMTRKKTAGKPVLIYNSLDTNSVKCSDNKQEYRTRFAIANRFWIGTTARFVSVKNLEMLVQSGTMLLQKNLPFHISIFGDGPLRVSLDKMISSLSLQNHIKLEEFDEDILPIISSFDVFVLCSHHEGMPMSLLEAMALGRPVVCTAVGGMKEIIEDRINGLLVPDNDSIALADAIGLLHHDRKLGNFISRNARKTIEEDFDVSKTSLQLIDAYKTCLKK